MKYTAPLIILMTFGLVKAAELKSESKAGKFTDWKAVAENVKKVVEAKQKAITDLNAKLEAEPKGRVQVELAKVTTQVTAVLAEVKKITDLQESEYKNAKETAQKDAVAVKASAFGYTLVGKFLDFEAALKKATMTYTKEMAEKEGYSKVLDYLKGKVANLEKDGFLTSSLLAAGLLSVLAVGSTFN